MANNCGRIAAGISRNCDQPLVGGVSDELILINKSDITGYTLNVSNPQIVEAIALITSPAATGYMFEGFKSSVQPKTTLAPNQFRSLWNHEITFHIFDNTPATKQVLEGLKDGTFVAIVKNNNQGVGGNAVYELFGKGVGLELTAAESDKNNADTQGAWVLTLMSPETQKEPNAPASIYITDLTTTDALVASLY